LRLSGLKGAVRDHSQRGDGRGDARNGEPVIYLGKEVAVFEEEVAAALNAKHAVGCASGTDALILALLAAGIGRGDEVITRRLVLWLQRERLRGLGPSRCFVDIRAGNFQYGSEAD